MAGKSTLPLLLAAGVGAVLLTRKKPAKKKKKEAEAKKGVVASGSVDRTSIPAAGESPLAYQWRVRESDETYIAETGRPETLRDPDTIKKWTAIGEADTVEDAKDMALAWISEQSGYESEVEVVDSGTKNEWEWRVITDPERGFIGQYRLAGGQWLGAVEGPEYTEQFKHAVWAAAIKDWERKQAALAEQAELEAKGKG